ncbi:hypothetical protein K661_00278 [Piscirickettsia salmonis LF-89 = ATCC VR-1361]|nr:hypothetical protein K661_00278 [Piscirickettsia salmonis LF-89 = ATCC VR-1361]
MLTGKISKREGILNLLFRSVSCFLIGAQINIKGETHHPDSNA